MTLTSASAFVGREPELARLVAALHDAGQGRARAIVVEGESGAGKTRLLREFAAVAGEQGATVLFGRGVDCGEAGPPFWPFIEALRPLAGDAEGPGGAGLDRTGYFEEVLDRLEKASQSAPVALLLDDVHWADRSTRDLLGFLVANLAGGPGPLIVMAVRSEALVPGHPLVPLLGELRRSRRAEFLALDRLSKAEVASQVTSILGRTPDPELLDDIWRRSEGNPFFVEELLESARSDHEATGTLQPILAARLSALSPDARTVAAAVAASVGPVSHEVLAEVAGLPDAALLAGLRECVDHHVLVTDATTGTYGFRHGLLGEAAYASLLPGEVARLHAAYGAALSTALCSASAENPSAVGNLAAVAMHLYAAGDAERGLPAALAAAAAAEAARGYAEAHVQYERALELAARLPAEALERLDRVGLAQRAAEAGLLGGNSRRAVELLERALAGPDAGGDASGLWSALGRACWAAGESARALEAYDEAVRLAGPETAQRVRAVAAAAEARMLAGRYRESRELAEGALAVARRLGLPLEEAEILGTLGVDLALLGDAHQAMEALNEAVDAAEKASGACGRTGATTVGAAGGRGPHPLARALLNRAEVLAGPLNRLREATDVAVEGLEHLRRLGLHRSYAGELAAVLANTLFRAGRWDEAEAVIDSALADRPTGAAAVELVLARARLAVGRGRFEAARADLERVERHWADAAAPRYQAPLLTLAAGLALWEHRTADAREAVARALAVVADSDDVWLVAPVLWHGLRAESDRVVRSRALGDRADAAAAAEAAAALVERARTLHRGTAPAVRPVVAAYEALCVAEGARAGAQVEADPADVWADAAERWAALGQPYPAAYARFREAEAVLSRQSRAARASAALRAAHEVAVRLGAEPFRREIESLAGRARLKLRTGRGVSPSGESDGPTPPPTAAPAPLKQPGPLDALTARERDVLGLMVEGRSNREIAAALFISGKTASVHVSHILAKLGVRSRVQAVAVAHQVGMAGRAEPR